MSELPYIDEDITLKAFLLLVIVSLCYAIRVLYKSKLDLEEYVREQDKANLGVMAELTILINNIADSASQNTDKLNDLKVQGEKILGLIKNRLNNGGS